MPKHIYKPQEGDQREDINLIIDFVSRYGSTLAAVGLFVFSLWMSVQFMPVKNSIEAIQREVNAIQEQRTGPNGLVERYLVTEEQVKQSQINIREIKEGQLRIEEKLDRLIEREN